jgi:hypothetical protein
VSDKTLDAIAIKLINKHWGFNFETGSASYRALIAALAEAASLRTPHCDRAVSLSRDYKQSLEED